MSYFLFAFDPSTVATGVARFEHEELVYVDVIEADGLDDMISKIRVAFAATYGTVYTPAWGDAHAIVETPVAYPGDPRPNDILKVAVVAGACRAHFLTSASIHPSGWNHGRPKKVTHARIKDLLTPEQVAMVMAVSNSAKIRENAWDAVGIGLHHLGALK